MPESNKTNNLAAGPKQRRVTVFALTLLGVFLVAIGLMSYRAITLIGAVLLVGAGVLSLVFSHLDGMS